MTVLSVAGSSQQHCHTKRAPLQKQPQHRQPIANSLRPAQTGTFPERGYGTGTVGWPITSTCCSRDSHNFNEKTHPQHLAAESLEMDDAEAIAENIVAESSQRSGGSDHRPLSPVQPLALMASFETPRARHSRRACSTDDAKTPTGKGGTSPKAAASPAANGSPALSLSVLATLSTKTGPSQFRLKPFDLN